jgi:hypothetical protein
MCYFWMIPKRANTDEASKGAFDSWPFWGSKAIANVEAAGREKPDNSAL